MTFSPPDWRRQFGWNTASAAAINGALEALPDSDALASVAAAFLEQAAILDGAGRFFDDPDAPVALARLCYAAPFLLRHLTRRPGALEAGVLTGLRSGDALLPWPEPSRLTAPSPAAQPLLDEAGQMRLMRRWKYDNYIRLTARFLLGAADAQATCRAISSLADGLIRAAYTHAFGSLAARLGIPLRKGGDLADEVVLAGGHALAGGAVLAMGKLGGRELNYASDIDLIFVQEGDDTPCVRVNGFQPPPAAPDAAPDWWEAWERAALEAGAGISDGSVSGGGVGRPGNITSGEFHLRLARQASKLLSEPMAEGFGFRVDLDLRPQGREGLLAPTVAAMEHYYTGQAREWERMAMIKARQVIGSPGIAGRIQEIIRPFVYRRYLDYSALEGVAIIKHDIDRVHANSLERNIKLGRGGIRENEFLVQALQLLHGGKRPEVQAAGHQDALERLEAAGLLAKEERASIEADYWRLRGVENRLQMVGEQQTHDLPDPGPALTRVLHDFRPAFQAREPGAMAELEAARKRNQERFGRIFAGLGEGASLGIPETDAWRKAVAELAEAEAGEEALARIDAVFARLMQTRSGERCVFKLARLVGQEALYTRGTEAALPSWLDFIEQIGNRNAIYTLIETHPPIVPWVAQIFREGGRHARLLIRHPEFLESFFALRDSWDNLAADFEDIANNAPDEETFILELQNTKARGLIRVLTAYLGHEEQPPGGKHRDRHGDDSYRDSQRGDNPRDDTHRALLDALAEATVRACTRFAWRLTCRKMGVPAGGDETQVSGFAVLAMGKLGSGGLRFGSDLDLVFVHGAEGETSMGRAHSEFYTRLGQKVGTLLTAPTQFGQLYELDHRLRPFGAKGLLVPSLAAYRNFLAPGPGSGAEVWNFQAFTRIRHIAGEAALGERLIQEIAGAWRERRVPPREIAREAWDMLTRLLAEQDRVDQRAGNRSENRSGNRPGRLSGKEKDALPLKYAVGGLLGYEFLAQAHFLRTQGGEAGQRADWTAPPPHETMVAWGNAYRTIGALDERLSFYEPDGLHLFRPVHHQGLAVIARHWNPEEVRTQCSRMEEAIEGAFRDWGG